jgi:hypothetical protein
VQSQVAVDQRLRRPFELGDQAARIVDQPVHHVRDIGRRDVAEHRPSTLHQARDRRIEMTKAVERLRREHLHVLADAAAERFALPELPVHLIHGDQDPTVLGSAQHAALNEHVGGEIPHHDDEPLAVPLDGEHRVVDHHRHTAEGAVFPNTR